MIVEKDIEPTPAARFPFPLTKDAYRPTLNVEPARKVVETVAGSWGADLFDVDHNYRTFVAGRAAILDGDPTRFSAMPHVMPAQWDALLFIAKELAKSNPEHFELELDGDEWTWRNRLLGTEQTFVIGKQETLPFEPLEFIGRQVQEDLVLLTEREGELFVDATFVTFSAGWSPTFITGMSFMELHGSILRAVEDGMIGRAEAFIRRMQPNETSRRSSWGFTLGRRLDISRESFPEWLPGMLEYFSDVPTEALGDDINLRVELQHLVRLPLTGAVLFTTRTYCLPLAGLAAVPEWAAQTLAVIDEMPDDLFVGKGLDIFGAVVEQYLKNHVDPHEQVQSG